MNKRLYEINKIDSPLPAAALVGGAAQTTRAYDIGKYRKALFSVRLRNIDTLLDDDLAFTVSEASDIAAATAQNVGGGATTPTVNFVTAVDACVANANIVQLTLVTVGATENVTINGVTFTAVNGPTVLADNEFDMRGDDTADAVELVACINNALPNLIATNVAGAVTIQSREPGVETITVTDISDNTDIVPVTTTATPFSGLKTRF